MSFSARAVTTAERSRPPRGKSRAKRDSVANGNGIGSEANAAASDFPSALNQRTTAARGSETLEDRPANQISFSASSAARS